MSSIHDVGQFHQKFNFIPNQKPNFLAGEQMAMRLNFMLEELLETAEACGHELTMSYDIKADKDVPRFCRAYVGPTDLEKALDGLVDLVYVALGTADLMGFRGPIPKQAKAKSKFATIWWEAWSRVHTANMAKKKVTEVSQSKRGSLNDTYKPAGWIAPRFKDLLTQDT